MDVECSHCGSVIEVLIVEGERPCDKVDACCMKHDSCVQESSPLDNTCHLDFLQCIRKEKEHKGFSRKVTSWLKLMNLDVREGKGW